MSRRASPTVLTDAVASFQAEVTRLAQGVVGAVIRSELARRESIPLVRPRGRPKGSRNRVVAPPSPPVAVQPEPPASPPELEAPPAAGKRTPWTRETIIELLAQSIVSGAPTDAAFMTRHGPRGAVAATRRLFGRFEAGMNVAALHVSRLYPEGLPQQRTTIRRASR
ncbi:MAG TPA: hypothetical protein VGC42_30875 [Kofleriaceae bacterium]